jgi:hypothetical protein
MKNEVILSNIVLSIKSFLEIFIKGSILIVVKFCAFLMVSSADYVVIAVCTISVTTCILT